jgi:hypothetical protein
MDSQHFPLSLSVERCNPAKLELQAQMSHNTYLSLELLAIWKMKLPRSKLDQQQNSFNF